MKYRCVTFAINEQGVGEVGESYPTLLFFRLRHFSMLECSTIVNVKTNKNFPLKMWLRHFQRKILCPFSASPSALHNKRYGKENFLTKNFRIP